MLVCELAVLEYILVLATDTSAISYGAISKPIAIGPIGVSNPFSIKKEPITPSRSSFLVCSTPLDISSALPDASSPIIVTPPLRVAFETVEKPAKSRAIKIVFNVFILSSN